MMTMTNWNNIVRRISDCAQYLCFIKKILDITTLGQRCLIIIRQFFFSTKPISTPHNRRLETIWFDSCFSTLTDNRGCTSPSHSRSTTVHDATLITSHLQDDRSTSTSHTGARRPSTTRHWSRAIYRMTAQLRLLIAGARRPSTTRHWSRAIYKMTAQLRLLTAGAHIKPSHSRSTHQAFLQQEHLSQAVCRPTCHWRLDTRWPRSEGGCGLSLTHHAPHKSSHSRSPHLPSLFIAGAQRFKYFHSSLDSRWLSSEGGGRLSMTPPHTSQHLCISPPTLSHTPRAWYYRQLRYLDITRRLQHSKQSDKL